MSSAISHVFRNQPCLPQSAMSFAISHVFRNQPCLPQSAMSSAIRMVGGSAIA